MFEFIKDVAFIALGAVGSAKRAWLWAKVTHQLHRS